MTDEIKPEASSREAVELDIAEYMVRNWTRDQIVEFCLKMFGTATIPEVVGACRIYLMRKLSRDEQVSFCLHILGDEAQAWWARKQGHQE